MSHKLNFGEVGFSQLSLLILMKKIFLEKANFGIQVYENCRA